jgi:hypothetical protein
MNYMKTTTQIPFTCFTRVRTAGCVCVVVCVWWWWVVGGAFFYTQYVSLRYVPVMPLALYMFCWLWIIDISSKQQQIRLIRPKNCNIFEIQSEVKPPSACDNIVVAVLIAVVAVEVVVVVVVVVLAAPHRE